MLLNICRKNVKKCQICRYHNFFSSSRCTKSRFRPGLSPIYPTGEAYDAPPTGDRDWGGGVSILRPLQSKLLATPMRTKSSAIVNWKFTAERAREKSRELVNVFAEVVKLFSVFWPSVYMQFITLCGCLSVCPLGGLSIDVDTQV